VSGRGIPFLTDLQKQLRNLGTAKTAQPFHHSTTFSPPKPFWVQKRRTAIINREGAKDAKNSLFLVKTEKT